MTRISIVAIASGALLLGTTAVLTIAAGFGTVPGTAAMTAKPPTNDASAPMELVLPPDDSGYCEGARSSKYAPEDKKSRLEFKCCGCTYVCEDSSKIVVRAHDRRGDQPAVWPCTSPNHCRRYYCPAVWNDPEKGRCDRSSKSERAKCKWGVPYCVAFVPI
jgi:hypothetical protein